MPLARRSGIAFRYSDGFDAIGDFGVLANASKVKAWRLALAQRDSVRRAVRTDYPALLHRFLLRRGSALSNRMRAALPV